MATTSLERSGCLGIAERKADDVDLSAVIEAVTMDILVPTSTQDPVEVTSVMQQGDDVAFTFRPKAATDVAEAKTPSSTWLATYQNALWPVVLASEERVPHGFRGTRRSPNEIPAILLGKHKYIWVSNEDLREFDPNIDYLLDSKPFEEPEIQKDDDEKTTLEKQRRSAFTLDASMFSDEHYWHNYITQKSNIRKLESQRALNEQHKKRDLKEQQRKASKAAKKRRRSSDDGSESSYRKRSKSSTGTSCKEFKKMVAPDEGADYDTYDARRDSVASDMQRENDSTLSRKTQKQRTAEPQTGSIFPPSKPPKVSVALAAGPNECRILIGPRPTSFIVPLSSIGQTCFYLLSNITQNAAGEHIIDLTQEPRALELHLNDKEFKPIHSIMCTNDLYPDLEKRKAHLSTQKKSDLAEGLARMFITAYKIQDEAVEFLIHEKLYALHPLPDFAILVVARILLSMNLGPDAYKPEKFLRAWIIDHIAYNFNALQDKYKDILRKLMNYYDDVKKTVLGKVQERLQMEYGGIGK